MAIKYTPPDEKPSTPLTRMLDHRDRDIESLKAQINKPLEAPVKKKGGFQTRTTTKTKISIWIENDVRDLLKASGHGWQGRINSLLREALAKLPERKSDK